MEGKLIDQPLKAVIRKGKSHYVCDERLKKRLKTANLKKKNRKATDALLSLKTQLGMDSVACLNGYDRECIWAFRSVIHIIAQNTLFIDEAYNTWSSIVTVNLSFPKTGCINQFCNVIDRNTIQLC